MSFLEIDQDFLITEGLDLDPLEADEIILVLHPPAIKFQVLRKAADGHHKL